MNQHTNISSHTMQVIEEEIRSIIDRNYDRAQQILTDNIEILHSMAKALMKYETIDTEQINEIMQGNDPSPPKGWDDGGDGPGSPVQSDDKPNQSESRPIGGPAGEH